jgi:hypothetical protein
VEQSIANGANFLVCQFRLYWDAEDLATGRFRHWQSARRHSQAAGIGGLLVDGEWVMDKRVDTALG